MQMLNRSNAYCDFSYEFLYYRYSLWAEILNTFKFSLCEDLEKFRCI